MQRVAFCIGGSLCNFIGKGSNAGNLCVLSGKVDVCDQLKRYFRRYAGSAQRKDVCELWLN
ncbi:hypothetical protein RUMCAL_02470 [Ruminococcus callidus ATCC 27760]|uniref:Uncharacterized protein n=1 Tax=Ruminococcus callidus ATCC 27760 TaxID=411473 RepID=U2LYU2_9FIRM|nr:hypothetical protein RUMCAL_02470 [Ruminococcus callidus ATCC 27760]